MTSPISWDFWPLSPSYHPFYIMSTYRLITQAQKIVVWKLSVSLQNLRWNFIFILLCCCCQRILVVVVWLFLRGRIWLVNRFTPCGQLTNQRCPLKQAESCWTFHYVLQRWRQQTTKRKAKFENVFHLCSK